MYKLVSVSIIVRYLVKVIVPSSARMEEVDDDDIYKYTVSVEQVCRASRAYGVIKLNKVRESTPLTIPQRLMSLHDHFN